MSYWEKNAFNKHVQSIMISPAADMLFIFVKSTVHCLFFARALIKIPKKLGSRKSKNSKIA